MSEQIKGLGGLPPVQPQTTGKANTDDSPEFRRILERLEKLAQEPPSAPPQDAEQLKDALQKADDGFTSAMDLRRKLEEAFRARLT